MSPIRFSLRFALLLAAACLPVARVNAAFVTEHWDAVDGYIVIRATMDGVPVGTADGLTWKVLAGSATVEEDPFTKLSLFKPSGATPVVAEATLGKITAPAITVGIDPMLLPADERRFYLAGGGLCAANPNHALCFAVSIDVRSVVSANVIPLSLTERLLLYRDGEYWTHDEMAGPMRITFNPELRSQTVLTAVNPVPTPSDPFFPAMAQSEFYFIIDMLDFGISIFNPQAMSFLAPNSTWPVFENYLDHRGAVPFHFVAEPETACMTIENQYMSLYRMSELDVTVEEFTVAGDGTLSARWQVQNTSAVPGDLRIFFFGNIDEPPQQAVIAPAGEPGDSIEIVLNSEVSPSVLTQYVAVGVVSESGKRLTGSARTDFEFPSPPGDSVPTVSQWGMLVIALVILTVGTLILIGRRAQSAA